MPTKFTVVILSSTCIFKNKMNCKFCNEVIIGRKVFCNSSCAASFNNKNRQIKKYKLSKEGKKNVVAAIKRRPKQRKDRLKKDCLECTQTFLILPYQKTKKFCSVICANRWINKNKVIPKRSKNEIYFSELCAEKFEIKTNYYAIDRWDADIFIPSLNLAIFWNGIWHYKDINNTLKQTQNRDQHKERLYKDNKIDFYIIKDLGSYNKKFVEDEFQKFCKLLNEKIST